LHQRKDLNSTPAQRRRSQPPQWRGSVPSQANERKRFLLHKLRHIKNGAARESEMGGCRGEESKQKQSRALFIWQTKQDRGSGRVGPFSTLQESVSLWCEITTSLAGSI